jgi:tetratricopeptide (TPR) repeat protein
LNDPASARCKDANPLVADAPRAGALSRHLLILLALSVLTVVAFIGVRHNGYINLDDNLYVFGNPNVNTGLTWANVQWAFTVFYAANWHPLTWLSLMLDVQWFGLNPGAAHLVNLVLHAATVILLYLFFVTTTGKAWRSAFVAAVFAVHPIHVESVAWIAERKDVLSAVLFALMLNGYAWYARKPVAWRYTVVLILFGLGLLAKPMLVTAPFVLLLLDVWPLRRVALRGAPTSAPPVPMRRILLEKLGFLPLAIASCIVTYRAQASGQAVISESLLPLDIRIPNAVASYVRYILKAFWPVNYSVYYVYRQVLAGWTTALGVLVLLLITLWCLARFRRRPYLLVGWLIYIGMLVPVIGIVQVGSQQMANRYMYLPLIGLSIMVAWGIGDAIRSSIGKKLVAGLALAAVVFCAFRTSIEVSYWKNSITLFTRAVSIDPENHIAQHNLADAYNDAEMFQEAIAHDRIALRLWPTNWRAHAGIGLSLAYLGRFDEAHEHLQESLRLKAENPMALFVLGYIAGIHGRHEEAIGYLSRAIAYDSRVPQIHYNLGVAYLSTSKPAKAQREFETTLKLDPFNAGAYARLGAMLLAEKQYSDAKEHLEQAVARRSNDTEAWINLWLCNVHLKSAEGAIAALRHVVELSPDHPQHQQNLAWLLATSPRAEDRNGAEALKLAQAANQATQASDPSILDTLAATWAEIGNFDEAVRADEKALTLAQQFPESVEAKAIAGHLDQLRRREPIRDDAMRP